MFQKKIGPFPEISPAKPWLCLCFRFLVPDSEHDFLFSNSQSPSLFQTTKQWQEGSPVVFQLWDILTRKYKTAVVTSMSIGHSLTCKACISSFCCLEQLAMPRKLDHILPSRHYSCTALFLMDIAQPLWYSIGCNTNTCSMCFLEYQ